MEKKRAQMVRDPDRGPRHPRPPRPRGHAQGPAGAVRRIGGGGLRVRRPPASDRERADDLAALHRRVHDRAARLTGKERVLEIGTGSGYQSAILAELAAKVYSIEIRPELAAAATARLKELGIRNVEVRAADGYRGWPEEAPFDGILVTAAPEHVPPPLLEQLASTGRMVIPVGAFYQELKVIDRQGGGYTEKSVLPVRFVPFVGEAAGAPPEPSPGNRALTAGVRSALAAALLAVRPLTAQEAPPEKPPAPAPLGSHEAGALVLGDASGVLAAPLQLGRGRLAQVRRRDRRDRRDGRPPRQRGSRRRRSGAARRRATTPRRRSRGSARSTRGASSAPTRPWGSSGTTARR